MNYRTKFPQKEKAMNRKLVTALATLSLTLGMSAVSRDAPAAELKLAHFVAPTHPYHPVFQWLAGEVDKETKGAL
ncbi:MAG: hypothetical protein ACREIB_00795, partial [Pseudomonadota bacterium]